jgi:hypothetical protein
MTDFGPSDLNYFSLKFYAVQVDNTTLRFDDSCLSLLFLS